MSEQDDPDRAQRLSDRLAEIADRESEELEALAQQLRLLRDDIVAPEPDIDALWTRIEEG